MSSRKVLVWAFLFVAAGLWGCSKNDGSTVADEFNANKAATLLNLAYGNGTRQTADIYLPANRTTSKTGIIVLLHGGSWVAGDKADLNPIIPNIQQANTDVAIVNMNYTLADGTVAGQFPAQLNDIHALLKFMQSKAAEWKISEKISLVGISSGAHLAMMYTFSFANPVAVKMVASIVGPADLTDPLYINTPLIQNVLTSFLGKSYNQDPALHRNASPVAQVKAGLPPVFMSYGEKDELVPLAQANALHNKLKQSGITTQLLLYPAEGHEFSKSAIDDTILKLASFYKNNVP